MVSTVSQLEEKQAAVRPASPPLTEQGPARLRLNSSMQQKWDQQPSSTAIMGIMPPSLPQGPVAGNTEQPLLPLDLAPVLHLLRNSGDPLASSGVSDAHPGQQLVVAAAQVGTNIRALQYCHTGLIWGHYLQPMSVGLQNAATPGSSSVAPAPSTAQASIQVQERAVGQKSARPAEADTAVKRPRQEQPSQRKERSQPRGRPASPQRRPVSRSPQRERAQPPPRQPQQPRQTKSTSGRQTQTEQPKRAASAQPKQAASGQPEQEASGQPNPVPPSGQTSAQRTERHSGQAKECTERQAAFGHPKEAASEPLRPVPPSGQPAAQRIERHSPAPAAPVEKVLPSQAVSSGQLAAQHTPGDLPLTEAPPPLPSGNVIKYTMYGVAFVILRIGRTAVALQELTLCTVLQASRC